jgi:hypothetical protein
VNDDSEPFYKRDHPFHKYWLLKGSAAREDFLDFTTVQVSSIRGVEYEITLRSLLLAGTKF